jgi:hypothetical protein
MTTFNLWMETHHRGIIFSLAFVVVFFAAACTLHDVIPICHYVFGCDHQLHMAALVPMAAVEAISGKRSATDHKADMPSAQ